MKDQNITYEDEYVLNLNLKVDDPLLKRKKGLSSDVHYYQDIPLPSIVEISGSATCNRACSFCPRSAPNFPDIKVFIEKELIKKLADGLARVGYKGMLLFSGFVEPLLDKKISALIKILRTALPDCRIEMVTNGDPITVTNLNKIHRAGLNALLVSCYDGEHQIDGIKAIAAHSQMPIENIVFRPRWSSEKNFGISLSNRGGLMENAEFPISSLSKAIQNPCYYPANTFFLDYNGEVLMCAHDWGKKAVVGNLNQDNFLDIWAGKKFSKLRDLLIKGNRSMKPCNLCNVKGTRMGVEHAEAWMDSNKIS